MKIPATSASGRHRVGAYVRTCANQAPKGRLRKAQGASPGFRVTVAASPEGAAHKFVSPAPIVHLGHSRHTDTDCFAPSGLPLLMLSFPGLAPWAFLSRPFGARTVACRQL